MFFSFDRRKKQAAVRGLVQRLLNGTTPNSPPLSGEHRSNTRYNRTIPTVLAVWNEDQAVQSEPIFAVTKDFCDVGIGLLLSQRLPANRVICGFWLGSPHFVLADVRHQSPLGGGFWQMGVELSEVLEPHQQTGLGPLAERARQLVPGEAAALHQPI